MKEIKKDVEEHTYKVDNADEWLQLIYEIGYDYDGFNEPESLKELIDEIVDMARKARKCLYENKLFRKEE